MKCHRCAFILQSWHQLYLGRVMTCTLAARHHQVINNKLGVFYAELLKGIYYLLNINKMNEMIGTVEPSVVK